MHAAAPEASTPAYVAQPVPAFLEEAMRDEAPRNEDAREQLPVSWASAFGHHEPFAQASAVVHARAEALAGAIAPDAGAIDAEALERITSRLDAFTRASATAFHAPDATLDGKLAAVADAAETILAWSRRLDAFGFESTAGRFQADPRVGLSFEDVAHGPGRRWRGEGLALAKLCITLADRDGKTRLAAECRSFVEHNPTTDPGTATRGCACDPGDPLCSSSMSGWCRKN